MAKKYKRRVWTCRYCGKEWSEDYLADLCFKKDMELLESGKKETKNEKNKISKKR